MSQTHDLQPMGQTHGREPKGWNPWVKLMGRVGPMCLTHGCGPWTAGGQAGGWRAPECLQIPRSTFLRYRGMIPRPL